MKNKKTKTVNGNLGHVSKFSHRFYFVKLSSIDPESISIIKKEEKVIQKMNQDICEITEMITKNGSKRDYLDSVLNRLKFSQHYRIYYMENREKVLRGLYMALDELNFRSMKKANGGCLGEKLDENSLSYLKLHGSKSLAEEKQILRDIKIQQKEKEKEKDVASFKSLEVLKETISDSGWSIYYCGKVKNLEQIKRKNDLDKLVIEIEQFQVKHMERHSGNDFEKGNISNYECLKQTIKYHIKYLCERKESETRIRYCVKEHEDINAKLYSLSAKLIEKHKNKDEAYQRIFKLKNIVSW